MRDVNLIPDEPCIKYDPDVLDLLDEEPYIRSWLQTNAILKAEGIKRHKVKAFEIIEKRYMAHFGRHKYKSFASFKAVYHRWIMKNKSNNVTKT